jgi:tetratricopeptide repeat protein
VHCIIAVNNTNGTFRRAALAQLHGDADGTTAFASQALAKTGEDVWMLDSTARMQLAMAEWLRGRVAVAERAFAASIIGWRAVGERYSAAYGCHQLGQVQRAQGDHAGAIEAMGEAGRVVPDPAVPGLLNPIPAQRARLLLARSKSTSATSSASSARPTAPRPSPGPASSA